MWYYDCFLLSPLWQDSVASEYQGHTLSSLIYSKDPITNQKPEDECEESGLASVFPSSTLEVLMERSLLNTQAHIPGNSKFGI